MDGQKPPGGADHPEKAEYKYPTRNCINTQFCQPGIMTKFLHLKKKTNKDPFIYGLEELININLKNKKYISNNLTEEDLRTLRFSPVVLGRGVDLFKAYHDDYKVEEIKLNPEDRKQHLGVLGSTGCGKTSFLINMIRQDIKAFRNVIVFDPKGDLKIFGAILESAAEVGRLEEVLYTSTVFPGLSLRINLLRYFYIPDELIDHVVSGIKAKEEFFINIATEVTYAIVFSLLTLAGAGSYDQDGDYVLNFYRIKEKCDFNKLRELKEALQYLTNHSDPVIRETAIHTTLMLEQILNSPQEFFGKVSSSLRTVLTALSTSVTGEIMGKSTTNEPVRRLENNDEGLILYCHTGDTLARGTAHIIARVMTSMIQAAGARKMATGKAFNIPLCVYMDEGHNVLYPRIQELFNKGRSARIWLHLFTQSYAQIVEVVGEERAKSIRDNINTWAFMRIAHEDTMKQIEESSPPVASYTKHYSLADGHTLITTREDERKLVLAGDLKNMPDRHFILVTKEGRFFKCETSFVPDPAVKVIFPEIKPREVPFHEALKSLFQQFSSDSNKNSVVN